MSPCKLAPVQVRHRVLCTPEVSAVARIESELLRGARDYMERNGFTEVVVPRISRATGSCENMDTLFEVDHFGKPAYLCQTGQLYLESLIPYLGRVYCVGSSFRSEPDVDSRHLTEFTLVEIELPCDLPELMAHIEGIITNMVEFTVKNCREDLEMLGVDLSRLTSLKAPFKKITYTTAINTLAANGFDLKWGDDLKSKHEAFLVQHFGNKPLFITHYPKEIKFFNMKENRKNPEVVNSTDLCLPFSGEAVGSAEREHEHNRLLKRLSDSVMLKQLEARGGSIKDFDWYFEMLKEGKQIPHAGCGIGLNRVTQFVLGSNDIRASTVYPQNRATLM